MKLLKLLLQAYGPFTAKTVDFSTGPVDLHLIYGPNEADKSSGDMRIGGIFLTQAGERVGFVRRKGKGATLSRLNVETEQPDATLPMAGTYELELTGGMNRGEFEAMFGLNHARLREGGRVLLLGEGDVGTALFEASAGTGGIATLLATLENDA